MPAPLRIHLTAEEDQSLLELSTADGVPKRTKLRALALRLNADGWNVPKIAAHLKQSEHTIRATLERWYMRGLDGLWEMPGRGRKSRWTEADISAVEQWLAEERSYSSSQLSEKLAQERGVQLGARRLQRLLKKRGGVGSDCAKVPRQQNQQIINKQNKLIGCCSNTGQS